LLLLATGCSLLLLLAAAAGQASFNHPAEKTMHMASNEWVVGSFATSSAMRCSLLRTSYLLTHVATQNNQIRTYSQQAIPFEIPDIHFGVEDEISSSMTGSQPCFTLSTSLHLPAPLHRVWENFHVPETLNAITPPHLNFKIISSQPVRMCEGATIDYRLIVRSSPQRASARLCSLNTARQVATPWYPLQVAHSVIIM
jgi:hypothetical protein